MRWWLISLLDGLAWITFNPRILLWNDGFHLLRLDLICHSPSTLCSWGLRHPTSPWDVFLSRWLVLALLFQFCESTCNFFYVQTSWCFYLFYLMIWSIYDFDHHLSQILVYIFNFTTLNVTSSSLILNDERVHSTPLSLPTLYTPGC